MIVINRLGWEVGAVAVVSRGQKDFPFFCPQQRKTEKAVWSELRLYFTLQKLPPPLLLSNSTFFLLFSYTLDLLINYTSSICTARWQKGEPGFLNLRILYREFAEYPFSAEKLPKHPSLFINLFHHHTWAFNFDISSERRKIEIKYSCP